MMVPRVYQYTAMPMPMPRSPSPSRRRKGHIQATSASPSPSTTSSPSPPPTEAAGGRSSKPKKLEIVPAATPSQPVVIPTRSTHGGKGMRRAKNGALPSDLDPIHDPNAISPSMAALLAITAIPTPRRSASLRDRRTNGKRGNGVVGSLRAEDLRHSLSSSSPKSWSILQSAPDALDDDDVSTEKSIDLDQENWSMTSGSPVGAFSSFRSLSSDSMPSLDTDGERESAVSPSPPTPANRVRYRRDRVPSPVVPIPSDSEHPLAIASFPESRESSPPETPTFPTIQKRPPSSSSLKDRPSNSFTSNLTASLRLLKSAARTLSAPTRLQDPNTLTVSSRPPPSSSTTTTPTQTRSPPAELSTSFLRSANIDALPLHLSAALPLPPGTVSIQLQPYVASPLSTATATAPPIFRASTKPGPDAWEKKPSREPRENPDFLRVVVMEMNMRRAGKLSGEGRARIWLGPRQESGNPEANASTRPGIADGASGTGAVTLDGEVGEAHEAEIGGGGAGLLNAAKPAAPRRMSAPVPRRWVAVFP